MRVGLIDPSGELCQAVHGGSRFRREHQGPGAGRAAPPFPLALLHVVGSAELNNLERRNHARNVSGTLNAAP